MTRDMDTVREVLRGISEADRKPSSATLIERKTEAEIVKILYHIELLSNAGFISGIVSAPLHKEHKDWANLDLTWKGHEFYDTIRSPEVWRRTKEGLNKVGGWSVELAWELAKATANR